MHSLFSFTDGIYHYYVINYTSSGRHGVRTEIPLKAPIVSVQGHQVLPWGPHVPLPDQSLRLIGSMSINNQDQPAAQELWKGGLRLSPSLQERLIYRSGLILALWDTELWPTSPDRGLSTYVYLFPDWTQERGTERASELMS